MHNCRPGPKNPKFLPLQDLLRPFLPPWKKGADAVYVGLKDFSARAKAKNFTLEQLERMTALCPFPGTARFT